MSNLPGQVEMLDGVPCMDSMEMGMTPRNGRDEVCHLQWRWRYIIVAFGSKPHALRLSAFGEGRDGSWMKEIRMRRGRCVLG